MDVRSAYIRTSRERSTGVLQLKPDPLINWHRMYPLLSDEQLLKKKMEHEERLNKKGRQ